MINQFALSFLYIELDRTRNVRGHACLYTTHNRNTLLQITNSAKSKKITKMTMSGNGFPSY